HHRRAQEGAKLRSEAPHRAQPPGAARSARSARARRGRRARLGFARSEHAGTLATPSERSSSPPAIHRFRFRFRFPFRFRLPFPPPLRSPSPARLRPLSPPAPQMLDLPHLRNSFSHTPRTLTLVTRSSPSATIALGVLTLIAAVLPLAIAYV